MKVGLSGYDFPGLCGIIINICDLFYKWKFTEEKCEFQDLGFNSIS